MEKSRDEFISFMHQALNDNQSAAAEELYQFLVACFVRADGKKDGKLYADAFDELIEEAAKMPRKYGYAPKSESMYSSVAARKSARAKQFSNMDTDNNGYITLEEWIDYATSHIVAKMTNLPKDCLSGCSKNVSKDEFVAFCKKAANRGSTEYEQLYLFLVKNFQKGDVQRQGRVDAVAFDNMIEDAAAAPRRYGLAPKSSEMFASNRERLARRKEYFKNIDKDRNGFISLDEWIEYALAHITDKIAFA